MPRLSVGSGVGVAVGTGVGDGVGGGVISMESTSTSGALCERVMALMLLPSSPRLSASAVFPPRASSAIHVTTSATQSVAALHTISLPRRESRRKVRLVRTPKRRMRLHARFLVRLFHTRLHARFHARFSFLSNRCIMWLHSNRWEAPKAWLPPTSIF